MQILGIDIATKTGWSVIDTKNQLINYGVLTIPSEMSLIQRIKYFEHNLDRIITENNPDEIHIEDVILGISGAKTLAYLSRLNGIAISLSYNKVGNNIKLYTPTTWKANSFPDLNGMSKKVEIQISVCKFYNLITEELLNEIIKPLTEYNNVIDVIKQQMNSVKKSIDSSKKVISKKKATENDKIEADTAIRHNTGVLNGLKSSLKLKEKEIEKIHQQVSNSITACCGLTSDVCDSIGIAYCNI